MIGDKEILRENEEDLRKQRKHEFKTTFWNINIMLI